MQSFLIILGLFCLTGALMLIIKILRGWDRDE